MIACLTIGKLNAQPPKEEKCSTSIVKMDLPCAGETVKGELTFCITNWASNWQIKETGVFTGLKSGDIYTTHTVSNSVWHWRDKGSDNGTKIRTMVIMKEGEQIGVVHLTAHYTTNANGEPVVDIYNMRTDCY